MTGTQLGDVRRYDTRSSRRPVSNWKIGKAGISVMEQGMSEQCVYYLFILTTSHFHFCIPVRSLLVITYATCFRLIFETDA